MVANRDFFHRHEISAVLKHGILKRYPRVFASMAGMRTGRVVFFDGFAGPGKYDDGHPGSPLLALEAASGPKSGWDRDVECIFVEQDPGYAKQLRANLEAAQANDVTYHVWHGDAGDHVDKVLKVAGTDPLFSFLDPFGTSLSYDKLTSRLLDRKEATEVLLNINLEAVARIGGILTALEPEPHDPKTLGRVDTFFGGDWWREHFVTARAADGNASAGKAAKIVAAAFCERVKTSIGYDAFPVEVRRRPHHMPYFLLVLFYRHWQAPWKFNEQVSLAHDEWLEAAWEQDIAELIEQLDKESGGSTVSTDVAQASEKPAWQRARKQEREAWVAHIAENLTRQLATLGAFKLGERTREVYGDTIGLAREMDVKKAWDGLANSGGCGPRDTSIRHLEKAVIRPPA